MKNTTAFHACGIVFLASLLLNAGCGSGGGKDAISSQGQTGYSASSDCLICHTSGNNITLDPLLVNGEGTAGKHVLHVVTRGIECLACHYGYKDAATHMDGAIDTENSSARLVSFNSTNPDGRWIHDTGARTGGCSSLACHGPQAPEWYGAGSALPECPVCHTSSLDPAVTNGSDAQGKHVLHATNRGISCLRCHAGYTNRSTHMNGTKDTSNPGVLLVSFDVVNPSGTWSNDAGTATGRCSSLACHGPQNPDWYGTGSQLPACPVCHTDSLDPQLTNGSGTSGKHVLHVGARGIACLACHQNYTDQATHMNGTKDTVNPSVRLVLFDAVNPAAEWADDTGPSTGRCSTLACHGAQSPVWYGAGASLPACPVCHAGAYDPAALDISLGRGKHEQHVTSGALACTQCHTGYTNAATHMNGALDSASSSAALVAFTAFNTAGRWSSDTGICSNTYCHGNGTSVSTGASLSTASPAWNSASSSGCNLCHGDPAGSGWAASGPMYPQDQPKANDHVMHLNANITCNRCHSTTTTDGLTITDATKHINGVYDVAPQTGATFTYAGQSTLVNFTYEYNDPGGGKCSGITCHALKAGFPTTYTWGHVSINVSIGAGPAGNCGVTLTPHTINGTAPFSYVWNFGDGTTSTEQNPTHVYPAGTTYVWVTLIARDAYRHPGYGQIPVSFNASSCN